jgi:hypothetical protein
MINRKLTLIAFFLSYFIVTTFGSNTIPYDELIPHRIEITKVGSNKLTAHIEWESNGVPDNGT